MTTNVGKHFDQKWKSFIDILRLDYATKIAGTPYKKDKQFCK